MLTAMREEKDQRRLFFAFKTTAPWPESLPKGRLLREQDRHLTVAFLGNADFPRMMEYLENPPQIPFKVAPSGIFDKILFLPPDNPRVVAWRIDLGEYAEAVKTFHRSFIEWLKKQGFSPSQPDRELLSHVTLCRSPFQFHEWRKAFTRLPVALTGFHLYESVGNLVYESRWEYPMKPPFVEIEHTADIAFIIRGENLEQIHHNAKAALAFHYPPLLRYYEQKTIESLEDLIILLNEAVTKADSKEGCSFKAVSFHGEITHEDDDTLAWEMIVDV